MVFKVTVCHLSPLECTSRTLVPNVPLVPFLPWGLLQEHCLQSCPCPFSPLAMNFKHSGYHSCPYPTSLIVVYIKNNDSQRFPCPLSPLMVYFKTNHCHPFLLVVVLQCLLSNQKDPTSFQSKTSLFLIHAFKQNN